MPALLKGLIFGPNGRAMSPSHTRRRGRIYRYCVTRHALFPAEQAHIVQLLVERVDIAPDDISVTLHAAGIRSLASGAGGPGGSWSGRFPTLAGGRRVMTERVGLEVDTLTIRIRMRLQWRGGRKLIMTTEGRGGAGTEAAPR